MGLIGEAEEAVGEDDVDDGDEGDEGEVTLLGLTSTSFFSFRSTCLLFVPERKSGDNQQKGKPCGERKGNTRNTDIVAHGS